MQGKRLLIAALVFGAVDISQISAAPASLSADGGQVAATSKVAPPVCTRAFNGELRDLCSTGWSDGYSAGYAECRNNSQQHQYSIAPGLQDAAYVHGYDDGYQAGRAAC